MFKSDIPCKGENETCTSLYIQNKKKHLCSNCVFKLNHKGKSQKEVYSERRNLKVENLKIDLKKGIATADIIGSNPLTRITLTGLVLESDEIINIENQNKTEEYEKKNFLNTLEFNSEYIYSFDEKEEKELKQNFIDNLCRESEDKYKEFLKTNKEKIWINNGKLYGYPKCCIKEFCEDKKSAIRFPDNKTGFIPCTNHINQIKRGEIKIEDLITNRKCSTPFPDSSGSKSKQKPIRKKSKEQIEIDKKLKITYQHIDYTRERVCSGCGKYHGEVNLSHSHLISKSDCKEIGRPELIWDENNIVYHCFEKGRQSCHMKYESNVLRNTLLDYEKNMKYIKSVSIEMYNKYLVK